MDGDKIISKMNLLYHEFVKAFSCLKTKFLVAELSVATGP
jgi:hypothetical protein